MNNDQSNNAITKVHTMQVMGPNGWAPAGYSALSLAFMFKDVEVRNPYFSPDGKTLVNPVEAYGFELFHTGGGCMALKKEFGHGSYLLLTLEDSVGEPEDWEDCTLGAYSEDGSPVAYCELRDIPYAQFEGALHNNEILEEPRRLLCSCCGSSTTGRQWSNCDKGFGLCSVCIYRVRHKMTEEEFLRCYGVRGLNFGLSQCPPAPEVPNEIERKKNDDPGDSAMLNAIESEELKARYRAWASANLANDDLVIPANAQVDVSRCGAFVQAKVWVAFDSLPESEAPAKDPV